MIEHAGKIVRINNEAIFIELDPASTCGACHSHEVCGVTSSGQKVVEVKNPGGDFAVGQRVIVSMTPSAARRAVFLAYVLPLIIFVMALGAMSVLTKNEAVSAVTSMALLVVYFMILHRRQERLKKDFNFYIKKAPDLP